MCWPTFVVLSVLQLLPGQDIRGPPCLGGISPLENDNQLGSNSQISRFLLRELGVEKLATPPDLKKTMIWKNGPSPWGLCMCFLLGWIRPGAFVAYSRLSHSNPARLLGSTQSGSHVQSVKSDKKMQLPCRFDPPRSKGLSMKDPSVKTGRVMARVSEDLRGVVCPAPDPSSGAGRCRASRQRTGPSRSRAPFFSLSIWMECPA